MSSYSHMVVGSNAQPGHGIPLVFVSCSQITSTNSFLGSICLPAIMLKSIFCKYFFKMCIIICVRIPHKIKVKTVRFENIIFGKLKKAAETSMIKVRLKNCTNQKRTRKKLTKVKQPRLDSFSKSHKGRKSFPTVFSLNC